MKGSGLEDLAVAAGIVEARSSDQALKGKHYKRGIRLHKLMYECLARLLISSIIDDLPTLNSELNQLSNQVFTCNQYIDAFEGLFTNANFQNLVQTSVEQIDIRNSPLARFWLSYMDMVEILYMHYHAMCTQNWEEYLTSTSVMLPWMFAYQILHYSRYLSLYWSEINNLDENTFLMRSGLFLASMSGRLFSALLHDQWIEMTMNKGSKMKAGWIGIMHNEEVLQVNTKVINNITKVKESLREVANIQKCQYSHIEHSPARMIKDVKTIHSLESGLLASEELVKEFDSANEKGEKQATKFLEERVLTNKKQIYDQINLNKQRNFSKSTVVKNTGKVCKTDAMENRAMVKIISLAETATVDLEEMMRYRLTEICLPLFNINGQMRKAVKSNFINSFEIHETTLEGVSYISIVDMGFIWRLATPSIANRESAECDFALGNYATKIFNIFLQYHPNAIE